MLKAKRHTRLMVSHMHGSSLIKNKQLFIQLVSAFDSASESRKQKQSRILIFKKPIKKGKATIFLPEPRYNLNEATLTDS
jgi:hypothetical protein